MPGNGIGKMSVAGTSMIKKVVKKGHGCKKAKGNQPLLDRMLLVPPSFHFTQAGTVC